MLLSKKILITIILITGFGYYAYRIRNNPPENIDLLFVDPNKSMDIHMGKTKQRNPNVKYKDGEYIGDEIDALYGSVQVSVTIFGGDILSVDILHYPDNHSHSRQINPVAVSTLVEETIQIQSADVDIVSGATQTSKGYIQSLQSALDQAII